MQQHNQITLISNLPVYTDLASEDSVFLGRKAQQKRIRKYMRMITRHTPGNLAAWEEAWKRWKVLTQMLLMSTRGNSSSEEYYNAVDDLSSGTDATTTTTTTSSSLGSRKPKLPRAVPQPGGGAKSTSTSIVGGSGSAAAATAAAAGVMRAEFDEEKQILWQNYTGFLAALGGCCLASESADQSNNAAAGDPRRISAPSNSEPAALVDGFMQEMTNLLVSENVFIRESVKETLGSDLSPTLYSILFKHLEATMNRWFGADGEAVCGMRSTLFVEQAVLVLKLILDRLVDPSDCLLSIDFSTLIHAFAKYLNKLPDNFSTIRMKIKMCHLVEAMLQKKEQIIVRDEMRLRNKLLEIIVEWTSDFALQKPENKLMFQQQHHHQQDVAQSERLHRDLDLACLKAIVALLQQLPLQSSEPVRETDVNQVKSRLFYKYFTFFLKLLNRCRLNEMESSTTTTTTSAAAAVVAARSTGGSSSSGSGSSSSNSKDMIPPSPATTTKVATTTATESSNYPDWAPLKDYTILAMSNLLSANVDAGLKYCLAMGYHEDTRTRTAFMQVLTNILNQGTEFETLAENVMTDRYEKLVDVRLCKEICFYDKW